MLPWNGSPVTCQSVLLQFHSYDAVLSYLASCLSVSDSSVGRVIFSRYCQSTRLAIFNLLLTRRNLHTEGNRDEIVIVRGFNNTQHSHHPNGMKMKITSPSSQPSHFSSTSLFSHRSSPLPSHLHLHLHQPSFVFSLSFRLHPTPRLHLRPDLQNSNHHLTPKRILHDHRERLGRRGILRGRLLPRLSRLFLSRHLKQILQRILVSGLWIWRWFF